MLMVARIKGDKEGYLDTSQDEVWQHVKDNYRNWREAKNVTLMYLTKRFVPSETSLIANAKDANSFYKFLEDNILGLNSVSGVYIFNLMKSKFFHIPMGTCIDLKRFTVTVNARPKEYNMVYNSIVKIKPEKYFVIGYIAYTFEDHGKDIVVSVLAKSISEAKKGIIEHIESLEGVLDTKIVRITKTKKLFKTADIEKIKSSLSIDDESPGLEMF